MHHHSTKQRLAALRRRFGIQLTPPKWAKDRRRKIHGAAAALRAAREEAARQIVTALTPAQHLSATDAARARSGGGRSSEVEERPAGGSHREILVIVLVTVALGIAAWFGLSRRAEPVAGTSPPAPAQAVAPTPPVPPPPPPPAAPKRLTVAKGDCLWNLSGAHLGDPQAWRRLFEANRGAIRNPHLIYPGQTLELP